MLEKSEKWLNHEVLTCFKDSLGICEIPSKNLEVHFYRTDLDNINMSHEYKNFREIYLNENDNEKKDTATEKKEKNHMMIEMSCN